MSDSATSTYEKEVTGNPPLRSKEVTRKDSRFDQAQVGDEVCVRKEYRQGKRTTRDMLPNGDGEIAALTPDITVAIPKGSRRSYDGRFSRCGVRKRTNDTLGKQPSDAVGLMETRSGKDLDPRVGSMLWWAEL